MIKALLVVFSSLLFSKSYDEIRCISDLRRFVDHSRLATHIFISFSVGLLKYCLTLILVQHYPQVHANGSLLN